MDWWIVALVLGELAFFGWIIQIVANYRLKREEQRAEERYRVVQRFESAEQLTQFLASEAGEKLLASTDGKKASSRRLLLLPIFLGLLCLFVGLGLLISGKIVAPKEAEGFLIGGVLVILGGLGFLAGAALSLRLVNAWGPCSSQLDGPPAE